MSERDTKPLSEMRVVELRAELERRGLDRSGNKQTLLDRLQKYLNEISNENTDKMEEENDTEEPTDDAAEAETSVTEEKSSEENTSQQDAKEGNTTSEPDTKTVTEDDAKPEDKQDAEAISLTLEEEEAAFHEDENEQQDSQKSAEETTTSDAKKSRNSIEPDSTSKASLDKSAAQPRQDKDDKTSTAEFKHSHSKSDGKVQQKSKKPSSVSATQNRNLWITNISKSTRATELKQALSAYGKVIGAKVVVNARFPGTCCYGYVTMDTVADADNCIAKLNNTELNGQIIKIEKVRPDHMNPSKTTSPQKKYSEREKDRSRERRKEKSVEKKVKEGEKKDERPDDKEKKEGGENGTSVHKSRSEKRSPSPGKSRERSRHSGSKGRHERSLSSKSRRERRDSQILTFDKIKEERERQRRREQERIMREEARRRREEAIRQREIERRQRSEAQRLEREREKLRIEREKIEREKEQLIRLERERQKLEREKLELEKLELQRAKIRMQEEDRRAVKRPVPFRRDDTYEERKRPASDRHFDEAPPPPRFDPPSSLKNLDPDPSKKLMSKDIKSRFGVFDKRDYAAKRDREYEERPSLSRPPPTTISKYENANVFNLSRGGERDSRRGEEPSSSIRVGGSKEGRGYERERNSPHYRQIRDERERRDLPDKTDIRPARDRYSDPKGRFERSSGSNSWAHTGSQTKVFTPTNPGGPNKTWVKDSWRAPDVSSSSGERWGSSNSRGGSGISGSNFSSSQNMGMGPTCPPPPGLNNYPADRFDYKSMSSSIRKY